MNQRTEVFIETRSRLISLAKVRTKKRCLKNL